MKQLFPVVVMVICVCLALGAYSKHQNVEKKKEDDRRIEASINTFTSGFDGLRRGVGGVNNELALSCGCGVCDRFLCRYH